MSTVNHQKVLRIFRTSLSTWDLVNKPLLVETLLPQDSVAIPSADNIQLLHIVLSSLHSMFDRRITVAFMELMCPDSKYLGHARGVLQTVQPALWVAADGVRNALL